MGEQLDIVSSAPRWGHGGRWPGPGRSGWFAVLVLGGILVGLGLTITLALQVAHQNDTINNLHAAVQNAHPAERYGLRQATCTGQHITTSALADATADQDGNLTIVAPNLASNIPEGAWVEVYRWADGTALGGIQGPLLGRGATTFRDAPTC
jgi:hypothetical protein